MDAILNGLAELSAIFGSFDGIFSGLIDLTLGVSAVAALSS